METSQMHAAAVQCGVLPEAIDEVTARVQARFAGSSPTPADVEAYIRTLPPWTKINMAYEEFYAMPETWRLTVGHEYAPPPPPVHARRPETRAMTPEELAAFEAQSTAEGWSLAERHARARVIQQSPAPEKG